MTDELPFDTITVGTGDETRRLGVAEFLALPFDHRVRAILQGSLAFSSGGSVVDTQRALRALRERGAAPAVEATLPPQPARPDCSGIRMHWRSANLLAVDFDHAVDDAACLAYIAEMEAVLARGRPYATLCAHHGAWPMPARQRQMQAAFIRRRRAELAALCRGIAFVIPHAVPRLVLTGILLLQPLPTSHAVFDDEPDALAWLAGRTAALGG